MTVITFDGEKAVFRNGEKVGTGQECCCGCCPCVIPIPESFGLQSILIEVEFFEFGSCYPTGGTQTIEIVEADQDNGFSFSKNVFVPADTGEVVHNLSLFCNAGCFVIRGSLAPTNGCEACSISAFIEYQFPLPSSYDEDGNCFPVGSSYELGPDIPFCDLEDSHFRVTATLVYA